MTTVRSARPAITPRSWVTKIAAIDSRLRRSSSSSRICFWIVTSSAVVGSSAMSSFGSQASAIAIITRWRIPPENWCGYSPMRSLACGMPTRLRTSVARSRACSLLTPRCSLTASAICLPTVIVGFSEVSGSWKIMPISLPRTRRMSSSESALISVPSSLMLPPVMDPPVGSSFMIDSAVMVLPHPDSPTMPRVSPGSTCSETPSIACTVACFSRISVRRSVISSSGATRSLLRPTLPTLPALQPGLERVPERVADEVEADAGQNDRDARRVDQPPVVRAGLQVGQAAGQHVPPVGRGRLDAEPQEPEASQDQDRVRDRERGLHDNRADRVRHDMPHDRAGSAAAKDLDRLHVLPGAQRERLAAHQPGHAQPVEHGD